MTEIARSEFVRDGKVVDQVQAANEQGTEQHGCTATQHTSAKLTNSVVFVRTG